MDSVPQLIPLVQLEGCMRFEILTADTNGSAVPGILVILLIVGTICAQLYAEKRNLVQ